MRRQIPTVNTNIFVCDYLSQESSAICQGFAELLSRAERGVGSGGLPGAAPGAIEEGSLLLTNHFCIEKKCRFGSKQSILQVCSDFTEITMV